MAAPALRPSRIHMVSPSSGTGAGPCVVKNTFLHVVAEGSKMDSLANQGGNRRMRSEPAKLRHPQTDGPRDSQTWYSNRLGQNLAVCPDDPFVPINTDGEAAPDWCNNQLEQSFRNGLDDSPFVSTNDDEDSETDILNSINIGLGSDCCSLPWQNTDASTGQVSTFSRDFSDCSDDSELSGQAVPGVPPLPQAWGTSVNTDAGSVPESLAVPDPSDQEQRPPTPAQAPARERRWRSRLDPMSWEEGVVTVMVRQIPRQFTQLMFLKEVNRRGFEGLYDFLYLPFDLKKGINIGYGFLSFVNPQHAQDFRAALDGAFLDKHMRMKGKPLRIHPAKVQGYEANYQHFMQTKTGQKQDPHFSPLFLPQGRPARLQAPPSSTMQGEQQLLQQQDAPRLQFDAGVADQQRLSMPSSRMSGRVDVHPSIPVQQPGQAGVSPWGMPVDHQAATQNSQQGQMADYSSQHQTQTCQQPGQQQNTCPACGIVHQAEHNFCASCGARVSSRVVGRAGQRFLGLPGFGHRGGGTCTPEDSAKLFQDLEAERHRLSKELADAQAKAIARQKVGTSSFQENNLASSANPMGQSQMMHMPFISEVFL